MLRIVLHSYVINLLKRIYPLHHFLIYVVEYDGVSNVSLVLQSTLDACLFLLLNRFKYIGQDRPFVVALEIDVLLVLVVQRLHGLVPQIHDNSGCSDWSQVGQAFELLVENLHIFCHNFIALEAVASGLSIAMTDGSNNMILCCR